MGNHQAFEKELREVLPPKVSRRELLRNPDLPKDPEVVWVGDGASWVWKLQQKLCPNAVPILDWMHAVQHATECGNVLFDEHSGLREPKQVPCLSFKDLTPPCA